MSCTTASLRHSSDRCRTLPPSTKANTPLGLRRACGHVQEERSGHGGCAQPKHTRRRRGAGR
eukprot:363185-Chlamydomonas_euryale.AAC.5